MILIADSGSTKTDWCYLAPDGQHTLLQSEGINPYFQESDNIAEIVREVVYEKADTSALTHIYFYGAGCSSDEKCNIVRNGLQQIYPDAAIEVEHDMMAAARALCNNSKGIICILGTGSNSVLFDGEKITEDVPSLGFILGDEGSGAYLGKELIRRFLYGELPQTLHNNFILESGATKEQILDSVYKKPLPNRYLATFSKFIHTHIENEVMYQLVYDAFNAFIHHHISKYTDYNSTPLHCTGSVGYTYKDILLQVCRSNHIQTGNIVKSPLKGLITYHEQQWKRKNNP